MKLLDLFFNTLADTNDIAQAIAVINKELLKRKTNLPKTEENVESFQSKHKILVELAKKRRIIEKIKKK